jgi:mevalonate kinase
MTDTTEDVVLCAIASAPGKLILFGEHAVVHQQPAVCAALSDLRIYVKATTTNDGLFTVHMPDLESRGVSYYRAPVEQVVLSKHKSSSGGVGDGDGCAKDVPGLESEEELPMQELRQILANTTGKQDEFAVQALAPVIYLVNELVPSLLQGNCGGKRNNNSNNKHGSGLELRVHSAQLPVGAGLGSSAAFSVACTAALCKLKHLLIHTNNNGEQHHEELWLGAPEQLSLAIINHYAYQSERIIHGTPSGIDNTVSCYGGALLFEKNEDGEIKKDFLKNLPKFDILLTNTGVPRSTRVLVSRVRHFKEAFPKVAQGILDSCGAVSR